MMGQGHCPSYKQGWGNKISVDEAEALKRECETGYEWRQGSMSSALLKRGPILPDTVNFFYSIVMDSEVINYSSFEEWARDTGMDPDSRKGEKIYQECLKTALAMNRCIGSEGLTRLQDAYQDS
jgi:hypothetical protein